METETQIVQSLKSRIERLKKANLYNRCLENEEAMYDVVINGADNCNDCWGCKFSLECSQCIRYTDYVNERYMMFNVQLTKEEYEKRVTK